MASLTTINQIKNSRYMKFCSNKSSSCRYNKELFCQSLLQNISSQDACGFVKGDEYSILWCSDSHGVMDGKKYFIRDFFNAITHEKWFEYLSQENFYIGERDEHGNFKSQLFKDIDEIKYKDIGATLTIVKIYPDKFECFRVGDSPIYIWRDGEIILHSDHDDEIKEDVEKLKERKYFDKIGCVSENGIEDSHDISALSPKIITIKPSFYIWWDVNTKLNMTRCIGHNNPTRFEKRKIYNEDVTLSLPSWTMTKHVIQRQPDTKEKVVITSDGITNVTGEFDFPTFYSSKNACEIMCLAYSRWKQPWVYKYKDNPEQIQTLPDWNRDDMAIVTWEILN
mgnify:CR=1 FL=1